MKQLKNFVNCTVNELVENVHYWDCITVKTEDNKIVESWTADIAPRIAKSETLNSTVKNAYYNQHGVIIVVI